MVVSSLGEKSEEFLNNNPRLYAKVKDYFDINNRSKISKDCMNYLLKEYLEDKDFNLGNSTNRLYMAKSTPLLANSNNPNRALSFEFNDFAIDQGFSGFNNVLSELFKRNPDHDFEGFIIRGIFKANGLFIHSSVSNWWLGRNFNFTFTNNNGLLITFSEENKAKYYGDKQLKKWLLDNDSDGYHSDKKTSTGPPDKSGFWSTTSEGLDCDDTKHDPSNNCKDDCPDEEKNSCGKCDPEPNSTNWTRENLLEFADSNSLLSEMLEKASNTVSFSLLKKTGTGGITMSFCPRVFIGEDNTFIHSVSTLAFELSHIINNEFSQETIEGLIEGTITREEYIDRELVKEAEGLILSSELRSRLFNNLSDCELNSLKAPDFSHRYRNLNLQGIKESIRSDGTLEKTKDLLKDPNSDFVSGSGETAVQHHGRSYDMLKNRLIPQAKRIVQRSYPNYTTEQIKTFLSITDPDCK